MGTRNLVAVMIDGEYKVAQYGQWDGYPSGQGATALEFLRSADLDAFAVKVRAATYLDEATQKSRWTECGADTDSDSVTLAVVDAHDKRWPELSRDTGATILRLIADSPPGIGLNNRIDFAMESLFCEYAYVIDLDKRTFELFRGFNKGATANTERFHGPAGRACSDGTVYHPIRHWMTFSLDALPTNKEFLASTNEEEEPAMIEYDATPDPTGHQWAEDDNRADDRIHAEKQAETDSKLSSDELSLLLSVLAVFIIDLHRLRRNPVMSEESRRTYSASIALAESTKRKLLGA